MNTFPASRRLSLALSFLLVATGALAPTAGAETAPMRAGGPVPAAPAAPAAAPAAAITRGKVLETMNASNYTYARVKTDAGEKWVAGPETKLKVGDTAEWPGGMEMKNFTSKSMGRTFESILFVDRLGLAGTTPPPAAAAAAPHGAGGAPHAAITNKSDSGPDVKGIAKAEGGVTVAEVYDRRAEFDGKEVTVRGKVVKFNAGVMDRNWLHLRDGSASKAGENDLTVTGDATVAVGDTVVVKGKVALNRDFGFGYRYDVLVEGATVKVE